MSESRKVTVLRVLVDDVYTSPVNDGTTGFAGFTASESGYLLDGCTFVTDRELAAAAQVRAEKLGEEPTVNECLNCQFRNIRLVNGVCSNCGADPFPKASS